MVKSKSISFSNELENLTLQIINSGQSDFNEILKALPGVYPTTLLDCIKKLISEKQIEEKFLEKLFHEKQLDDAILYSKPTFRIPHPLDYHWKFSQETCDKLLNKAYELTHSGNVIGLIGAPSLLEKPSDFFNERQIISVDKNPLDNYSRKFVRCSSYTRDLLTESIPKMCANLIIADPPWYPEYYKSFLWSANEACLTNGHLLLSIPPEGIRPGMKNELQDIFNFAGNVGFSCIGYEKKAITYNMPQFERNALKAAGLKNISIDWRTADLAILTKTKSITIPKPIFEKKEKWSEIILDSIVIRVKEKFFSEFKDPTLISLVDGEIFPSVSRRNSKRDLIDVWTSGNRVYLCEGTNILVYILKAIQEKKSPIEMISMVLKRKLNMHEITLILLTVKKIEEIIISELDEL